MKQTVRVLFLSIVSAVAVGTGVLAQPSGRAASGARFLVVPFDNPGREATSYWLGEAAAVLLADNLNALGLRALTREERLHAFEQLQVPPTAGLSHATMIRLGQLVGATHVVIGSVRLNGDVMAVNAQSIRLDTGRLEPEVIETGPLDELFDLFERMGRKIAALPAGVASLRRPSLPAFEYYIKGLLASAVGTRVHYFQSALKLDADYDRVRLALWSEYRDQGNTQAALVAAASIPETSPLYGRARFSVALALIDLRRWDEGFATLKTMADRSPTASIMNNLGVIQLRRQAGPQMPRATHYFGEAAKLDEADADYAFNLGYAHWAEKNSPAAIHWLREAVRRNPADAEARSVLARVQQAASATGDAAREAIPRGLERLKEKP